MMRKKKYNAFKKHFWSTTPRYKMYIGKNVFQSWAIFFSQIPKILDFEIVCYCYYNFKYVTRNFLSDIYFLSMASFSCDMRLQKINTGKVYSLYKWSWSLWSVIKNSSFQCPSSFKWLQLTLFRQDF